VTAEPSLGGVVAEVIVDMYGLRSDAEFVALAREIGTSMDERLAATDELFDALRTAVRAVRMIGRSTWRQWRVQRKLWPKMSASIRKMGRRPSITDPIER
jgi:hypothetical protein